MESDPRPGLGDSPIAEILAQNRARLITIAQAVVNDRHSAEDIVQETAAATLRRLPSIAPEKLEQYLSRSVRRNAIKAKLRRREFSELEDQSVIGKDRKLAFKEIDPFDLEEAIRTLPLPQQTVVRMKYYLGLTYRQIGVSLSISTDTAASRCRYALEKLKRLLGE